PSREYGHFCARFFLTHARALFTHILVIHFGIWQPTTLRLFKPRGAIKWTERATGRLFLYVAKDACVSG
ncbi:hypothetical protein, partial [Pantoea ananatis]|uniref:hypothetical protein n=1 Tax=Pantoea ananas TaxID=553 RepID=UPI001B313BB3